MPVAFNFCSLALLWPIYFPIHMPTCSTSRGLISRDWPSATKWECGRESETSSNSTTSTTRGTSTIATARPISSDTRIISPGGTRIAATVVTTPTADGRICKRVGVSRPATEEVRLVTIPSVWHERTWRLRRSEFYGRTAFKKTFRRQTKITKYKFSTTKNEKTIH